MHPSTSEIVRLLGGPSRVARLLGIRSPSVNGWLRQGVIPEGKLLRLAVPLEAASGGTIRRWHVRPDDWFLIWPELVGSIGAPLPPGVRPGPAPVVTTTASVAEGRPQPSEALG